MKKAQDRGISQQQKLLRYTTVLQPQQAGVGIFEGAGDIDRNRPATPLNDAQQVGFLLPKVPFQKPALDIPSQITLLENRGMHVPDRSRAEHYLRFVGYYRLSGYWFPFQNRDNSASHSDFKAGTNFEVILDRYVFDRRLRVLIMDAVERIEVAIRSALSNTLCERFGPHWYLNASRFVPHFDHSDFLKRVRKDLGMSPANSHKQTVFVQHYLRKYQWPPEPPSWMVFEILSFGAVSLLFAHLARAERISIASQFSLPRDRLRSWLHATSHLRNLCAHHSRVWNREFDIAPTVAKGERYHVIEPKRFYNHAVALQTLLQRIAHDSHWADRLEMLFTEHPNVPLRNMGFPTDWRQHAIWQSPTSRPTIP